MLTPESLLPLHSLLLHIGPHKTGTTAVQLAFHHSRTSLLRHGIRYAGSGTQPYREVRSLVGTLATRSLRPADKALWAQFTTDLQQAPEDRVVVSSEAFANADEKVARRATTDLGPRPVHVAVTLRPLWAILPSQWQEYVQNGMREPYDEWLGRALPPNGSKRRAATFWRRHDHAALLTRWMRVVGPDNLTLIVLDDADRRHLLRSFEQLLDLPDGFLPEVQTGLNRSMTESETELVRRINTRVARARWPELYRAQLLGTGAINRMKRGRVPAEDEPRITTPRWAVERAARFDVATVQTVRGLGLRVLGDLDRLTAPPPDDIVRPDDRPEPAVLPIDAAALAVMGAIGGNRLIQKRRHMNAVVDVRTTSTRRMLRIIRRRWLGRLAGRMRRHEACTRIDS